MQIEQFEISQLLKDKLADLPMQPGVYQFKNKNGNVIYVGKAIKLRNRVRSYFQTNRIVDAKTKALQKNIFDLEIIVTDNESEALLLEDTLIKKIKPKYNINLKDGKTYPFVRITNEDYPRVFITRQVIKDGSKYFGPFTDVKNLYALMATMKNVLKIRSCDLKINNEAIEQKKFKACLDYHIKKCDAPCEGLIDRIEYQKNIKYAKQIISGKTSEFEKELEVIMLNYSQNLQFEKAGEIKTKLNLLREFNSKQKIISNEKIDRDIFAVTVQDDLACSLALVVREGKLIGKRHFIINSAADSSISSIVERTIQSFYLETDFVPDEIYLPEEPEDLEYITTWLNEKKGKSLNVFIPKIGDKRRLIEMAEANARLVLTEYIANYEKRDQVIPRSVLSLQRDLRLKKAPRIIECFDNSHIQGSELVSSMVQFRDGKPYKNGYRKFKNKTVLKNDDFAAMREVISRRYLRLVEEIEEYERKLANKEEIDKKLEKPQLPDLIIIDGGKGQLSSAVEIIGEIGLYGKVEIIGLAKRLEEVFMPGSSEATLLPRTSSSLRLIQHLRDEAHRFAITFHRSLRDKRTLQTELTQIEGIGKTSADKLLKQFGSVERIKKLDIEELSKYVNKNQANSIIDYFDTKSNTSQEVEQFD